MPDVAAVLKEEITRLARKEVKQQVGPLHKTITEQRRTIAELKRQVAALAHNQAFLQQQEKRRLAEAPKASAAEGVRFSPRWVKADHRRLGLSAKDYGLLVGVSEGWPPLPLEARSVLDTHTPLAAPAWGSVRTQTTNPLLASR